jgi:transcriptional regulator with XRE-family HTH domain
MPTTGFRLNGAELLRRRQHLRLSAAEVARALELHPNFYRRIEAGTARVSLSTLAMLEGYHGVDPEQLELVHPDERWRFVSTG